MSLPVSKGADQDLPEGNLQVTCLFLRFGISKTHGSQRDGNALDARTGVEGIAQLATNMCIQVKYTSTCWAYVWWNNSLWSICQTISRAGLLRLVHGPLAGFVSGS